MAHDIDLAPDELPHEAGPFGPLRHDEQEVLVVELGHAVLPLVPPLDLGRFLSETREGLGVDGPIEAIKDFVQGWQLDECLQERLLHASGGDEILQDFGRGRAERLPPDDRLDVLHVEPV